MKVTIAHPIAASELGCDIDATVEVSDEVGARLLDDGFARPAKSKARSPRPADTGADTEGA